MNPCENLLQKEWNMTGMMTEGVKAQISFLDVKKN
jgi:hypothetical protein